VSTACRYAAAIQQETPGFTMSINISDRQLERGTLVYDVHEAMAESGLAAELLILEPTESTVVRNIPEATRSWRGSASSAPASPLTTSAPGCPRWPRSASSPSTSSRPAGRS
jgi:hypothetical protein